MYQGTNCNLPSVAGQTTVAGSLYKICNLPSWPWLVFEESIPAAGPLLKFAVRAGDSDCARPSMRINVHTAIPPDRLGIPTLLAISLLLHQPTSDLAVTSLCIAPDTKTAHLGPAACCTAQARTLCGYGRYSRCIRHLRNPRSTSTSQPACSRCNLEATYQSCLTVDHALYRVVPADCCTVQARTLCGYER